jgi:large subunit ribosomal protein L35
MPKMKTNRGAAKRFKKTGSGRVRRSKCGHMHGMISKSRKHNRRLRKRGMVHDHLEKRIKVLLPYA